MKIIPALLSTILLLAAACSSDDEMSSEAKKPTVSDTELYEQARVLVAENDLREAIPAFEEVERQYPASPWATHSQVMAAYSAYKINEYDQAIGILDRFVRLYPNHESTPYAYYLIALCYYEQISDVSRDQKITGLAMQALRDVVRRFPHTEYARDAQIKLDLTFDHLAGKEMEVGRYYLVRDDLVAAINRFRYVVENFETTSHVPEALHRLVEAYLKMGIVEEAKRYAAVLGHNFPNSIWYRDSYKILVGNVDAPAPKDDSSWWPL